MRHQLEAERLDDADSDPGFGAPRPITVIEGDPGVGKSKLMDVEGFFTSAYFAGFRSRPGCKPDPRSTLTRSTADYIPVVRVKFRPTQKTIYKVIDGILTAFGEPGSSGADRDDSLGTAIRNHGTRLIVFDELQRLPLTKALGRDVLNLFRDLSDSCRVLIGITNIDDVVTGPRTDGRGAADDTLDLRSVALTLKPLGYDTDDEVKEWQQWLMSLEGRLILAKMTHPGWLSVDLASYMHAVSQGHMNSVVRLLSTALSRAMATGAECIDRALLDTLAVERAHESARATRIRG
ncbi:ATP-binding protein [Frondihabitans sucicola]|uniref:ATP-binding protein n=1 Tax=Frondihabitans sucicola TaxID=1268041 RepID=UPI0025747855|nr:ATP-binding protein [Frondihabitans sucicola]